MSHFCQTLHLYWCRKPALLLKPALQADSTFSFSIRLIPTISQDTFPLTKLTPERSNLRHATAAAGPATAAAVSTKLAKTGTGSGSKGKKRKQPDAESGPPGTKAKAAAVSNPDAAIVTRLPTPQYNTSIIADMVVDEHQQVLQSAVEAVPRLPESILLLKVVADTLF